MTVAVRRRRGTTVALGLIALLALAATACTTQGGEPTRTATSGSAPVPEVQLKDASQVKLALVGDASDGSRQTWQATARSAETNFKFGRVTVEDTRTTNQRKQESDIDRLAKEGYNAFGIAAASPAAANTTFENLKAKGLAVGSLGTCPAGETDLADFCLSTDVEEAAYGAAKAAIDAIGGEGSLVHLAGDARDPQTKLRIAGVRRAVLDTRGKVTELPVITGLDDRPTARKVVAQLLMSHASDLNGIVATTPEVAVMAADGVRERNLQMTVVGIGEEAETLDRLKSGAMRATVVENPAAQVYVGGWLLALLGSGQCQLRTPGLSIDSGSLVVTQSTVDGYEDARQAMSRQLQKDLADDLTCR